MRKFIYLSLYMLGLARDAGDRFLDRYGDVLCAISFGITVILLCAGWGD